MRQVPTGRGVAWRTKGYCLAVHILHPAVTLGIYTSLYSRDKLFKGGIFILDNQEKTKKELNSHRSKRLYGNSIRKLTLTAVFVALAIVTKSITVISLSMFGTSGIKINFGGIFTFFPAALFGPIYGGVACALSDFIGFLIAPTGAYIPWLTVTAFLGGFVKGLVWKWLKKGLTNKIRLVALIVCAVVGAFGIIGNVSLVNDGVLSGVFAQKEALMTKGELQEQELSLPSKIIVSLAKYNNDSFYISSAYAVDGKVEVPSGITVDGVKGKVTKILKGSFSDIPEGTVVYIPSSVKTIDKNAFGEQIPSNITIVSSENSAAQDFAVSNDISFEIGDWTGETPSFVSNESNTVFESNEFTFNSSDTYRKYLAGYTNLAVAGSEFVMILGFIFLAIEYALHIFTLKKKGTEDAGYLRIATSICTAGLLVTTINTWILRSFTPSWAGRMFFVLWVPRAAEELIVCLLQAYLISLLYAFVMKTRLKKYIPQ